MYNYIVLFQRAAMDELYTYIAWSFLFFTVKFILKKNV